MPAMSPIDLFLLQNKPQDDSLVVKLYERIAELKTEIHTLTEERDTAEARLAKIAAVVNNPPSLSKHFTEADLWRSMVNEVQAVTRDTTTPPASG